MCFFIPISEKKYTLCGVDTTQSHYGVSLRAYCASAGDTTGWSPLLWAPMVQSDNSIDDAKTALAASVKVNPNPSSGTVTVESHHLQTHHTAIAISTGTYTQTRQRAKKTFCHVGFFLYFCTLEIL